MNHTCNGTYFEGLQQYRCLFDGGFYKAAKCPKKCRRCHRKVGRRLAAEAQYDNCQLPITATIVKKNAEKTRLKVLVTCEVQHPSLGWMPFHRELTIKSM